MVHKCANIIAAQDQAVTTAAGQASIPTFLVGREKNDLTHNQAIIESVLRSNGIGEQKARGVASVLSTRNSKEKILPRVKAVFS